MLGAGSGGYSEMGMNSELCANFKGDCRCSKVGVMNPAHDAPIGRDYKSTKASCLANVLLTRGEVAPCLRVRASVRKEGAPADFIANVQKSLHAFEQPVTVGGVFQMLKGKAKIHVMSDFTHGPIGCKEFIDEKWLKYFD